MIAVTYLPFFVTILFRGMPGIWKSRHRLLLCWLVFMQALYPGRKTLEELARWTPGSITAWRLRRVLKAAYWNIHLLIAWWVQEAFNTLPPPKDGTLYLGGDGSVKPKRGTQNPVAQKGRKSEHQPWFWGGALRAVDRHMGELSFPRRLSTDSAQNPSGVPHGKCAVP